MSPVLLITGILVHKKMPGGPVIFKQQRVGQYGKLFIMYKFRTMTVGHSGSSVSVAGENRITPFGAKLRKYKLDELPELWNVLIGDMSFVGPRPDVPGYADKLAGEDRKILLLKPGITGPASIKYRNEEELLAQQIDPIKYNDEVIFPDKVKIMGGNEVGSHKWIEIELDNGNIIIADATDSINGELDLAKCKSSFSSNGFFYCNKFFSGARLEKINLSKSDKSDLLRIESTIKDYNEGEIDLTDEEYANLYNKYKKLSNKLDLENIGKDQWKDIDKKLGYFYYDDKIKKGNSLFKGSKLYKKLFGSEKFDNMVIDKFIDLEIPSNMEGLDAYVYLKKLSNIYGIESTTNFFCHNIGDNYEVVATWGSNNINRYKSNRNVYIVYSKSIGKKVFYNFEEYNNFVRNLTFN